MRGKLDQRIVSQEVDPAAETLWFHPLTNAGDLVDLRVAEPGRAEELSQAIVDGCGSSRSRRRAASQAYSLLVSLAARWLPAPQEVLPALAAALNIVPAAIGPSEFEGDEKRMDGPSSAEVVALQLIAATRMHGRTAPIRRAAYALADWYQRSAFRVPLIVANAIGVVLGAVAPDGQIEMATFAHVLGAVDPRPFRRAAKRDYLIGPDATSEAISQVPDGDPDCDRLIRKWRATEGYRNVRTLAGRAQRREDVDRANKARRSELEEALRTGAPLPAPIALPGVDHRAIWSKWNAPKLRAK